MENSKKTFKRIVVGAGAIVSAGIVLVAFLFAHGTFSFTAQPQDLARCITGTPTSININNACLSRTVAALLKGHSTLQLMNYIVSPFSPYVIANNCHAISHVIGEETFNVSTSLENTLMSCSLACSYGCIHGAIAAAVGKELGTGYSLEDTIEHSDLPTLEKIGASYCTRSGSLCHAIGHLLFIASASYTKALAGCDHISSGTNAEYCYEGVFMEASSNTSSLFPGIEMKKDTPNDYSYPCNLFATSSYAHACFMYLSPVQQGLFQKNNVVSEADQLQIMTGVCYGFSGRARADCFFGLDFLSPFLKDSSGTPINVGTRCDSFNALADRESCSLGIVVQLGMLDHYTAGIAYCSSVEEKSRQTICYDALFQYFERTKQNTGTSSTCDTNASSCPAAYQEYLAHKNTLPDYSYGVFGKQ